MYWERNREREITQLKNKIRKAAFCRDENNVTRIRTKRLSSPQFWESLKSEICENICQDLLFGKILEIDNSGHPQIISDLIMQGLERAFNNTSIPHVEGLPSRANPYAAYLTNYIVEDVINDPNIDVYGTDLEIYSLINRIFRGLFYDFLYQVAETIWKHKQHTRPKEIKNLIDGAKEENKRELQRIEKILQNSQYFKGKPGKKAIEEALIPLTRHLSQQLEKSIQFPSDDVKGFVQVNPRAHSWKLREYQLIDQIRELYNRYTPLCNNNYEIAYNMSLVLKACDLPFKSETIRKQLQTITKNSENPLPKESI
jgi:hypothetical protein